METRLLRGAPLRVPHNPVSVLNLGALEFKKKIKKFILHIPHSFRFPQLEDLFELFRASKCIQLKSLKAAKFCHYECHLLTPAVQLFPQSSSWNQLPMVKSYVRHYFPYLSKHAKNPVFKTLSYLIILKVHLVKIVANCKILLYMDGWWIGFVLPIFQTFLADNRFRYWFFFFCRPHWRDH